ncbi:hypothetical protein [Candidatus Amarolinea dominans]|uniref:hypothetical protein n=1 Tax=Candidatus Amarolinea dominans TaxID=3140696 RepID=UPI0031368667|nr:hypothetical protein [Anaerolineae bacterium]
MNVYQAILLSDAVCGLLLIAWFFYLSPAIEPASTGVIAFDRPEAAEVAATKGFPPPCDAPLDPGRLAAGLVSGI